MAENLRLRIAKKAYVFDIRKKFAYRQYFAPKKKDKMELRDLGSLLSGKRAVKKIPQKKEETSGMQSAAQGAAGTIKIAAFVIAALVLLLGVAWLYLMSVPPAPSEEKQGKISVFLDVNVSQPELLNLGTEDNVEYAIRNVVGYATANISSLGLSIGVYNDMPPSHVFVLDYPREGADAYGDFRAALRDYLRKKGMLVTDIDIEGLANVPPGATVVVPTGFVPSPLIFPEYKMPYPEIVERGVTIVYIGDRWNTVAETPDRQTVQVLSADPYGLSFSTRERPKNESGFGLFDPLYTVEGRGGRVIGTGRVFGSVSYVKMGRGYLLFVPQTIDGGWRSNGTMAGENVARLVFDAPWLKPVLVGNATIFANDTINASGESEIFTLPVKSPLTYMRIVANFRDKVGKEHGANIVLQAERELNSDIFMYAEGNTVAPTSITDQKIRMMFVLREGSSQRARIVLQTLREGKVEKSEEIEKSGPTALDSRKSYDYDASLSEGDYVLRLVDLNGNVYARAIMRIKEIKVEQGKQDWKNGRFNFRLNGPTGEPVMREVVVSMNGKDEQHFPNGQAISYNVSPTNLPEPGKMHTFTFRIKGTVKKLTLQAPKVSKPFWENPLVIVFGLVSLAIAGAGLYFAKPERAMFGLDVPDFPPMSQIKIPVARPTVLEIFEQVNKDYSWSRMPLRLKEIKDGFRKLTYNGKPILIGDYNLERMLEQLEREGHVKSSRGFWGLGRWEKESGHTMFYMSMYRQMRDVFVTNAVRFTKIGASPDYDVLVDIRKGGVYVQIYENEWTVARALSTAKSGPTIIVFPDEDRIAEFGELLVSTSEAAVSLKVHIDNGVVTATTIEKLEKLVKDLRGT
jgi:hypothetical protein